MVGVGVGVTVGVGEALVGVGVGVGVGEGDELQPLKSRESETAQIASETITDRFFTS